jgi:hypothetical protein
MLFINTDFEWGDDEAPGSCWVHHYIKMALIVHVTNMVALSPGMDFA